MSVLRTAYVNVLPKTDGFDGELKKRLRRIDASQEGNRVGKGFGDKFTAGAKQSMGSGLRDLAKGAMGLFVPVGIGAAVAEIGQIGMAYEDNLNIFKSVTKATGAQMDQVSEKARKLGADVNLPGVSAADAADAMTQLSKAGFSVQQSMDAAAGTLQLARIAEIDGGQAADIAAAAVNAFGIKAGDTAFVVDELAASANSSSVEIKDVSDSFKMAASVFSAFQGPAVGSKEAITELNTAIAILGNNGIRGSDAGTSLKQMLLQLTGPSAQAKDLMKELALNAAGATVSLDQQNRVLHGSKSVREKAIADILKHNKGLKDEGDIAFDASGKMRSLPQIIDLVTRGTAKMTQEERSYAITQIFGADASRSVIALMKGGLPAYEQQRKAVMAQGAAASVAAAKNAGLRGALDNVKSQAENAAIGIYNVVKGPLTSSLNDLAGNLPGIFARIGQGFTGVGKALAPVIGFLREHDTVTRSLTISMGALLIVTRAHAAALAVEAAGGLVKYIASIRIVSALTKVWTAVQWLLNSALFANPIGIVVLAIGALVGALIYAYKHSETFRKIVDAAWRGIAAAAKWAWENVIKPVVAAFVFYYTKIVGPAVMWLWHNVIEPAWHGIARIIQAAWVVIQIIFKAWQAYFQKVLFPVIRFLWNNVVKPIFAALGTGISQAWNKRIKPVFVALGGFIRDKVAPAFRAGVAAISAAWNGIKAAAAAPVRFVIDTVINKGIIGGINWVASKVGVKDRIPPIRWSGTGAGSAVGGAAAAAARRVRGGDGPGMGDGAGDGIGSLLAGPAKWLSNRMGIGRLTSRFGANPFVHTIAGAANKAKGFALDKIQSLITELFGAGGGSVGAGGLRTGILSVLGALRGTFGSVPLISGLRRGARTLSGNVSYHASGRAIDIPAVYAWARYLAATWGSRLKELITPWREFNMLNGHPHRYSYAIEAQHGVFGHNRHIHAALDDGGTRVLRPGYNVIPNWTGRPEPIYGPVAARSMGGDIHIHLHNPVIASKRQAVDLVVEAVTTARRERRL